MASKILRASFDGGELDPELYGRVDLAKFQTGLKKCRNFITRPQGAAINRAGLEFVKEVKYSDKVTRLIPFIFSPTQAYVIEFGDQYVRFHTEAATILEASQNITGVTSANPAVATISSHGYANGDEVYIDSLPGDFAVLNGRYLRIANVATHTFELQDELGNDIDASAFGAYTSGGTASRPLEYATPYLEADLFDLTFAQAADTVTITHTGYAPRELVRLGALSWSLGTITFAPGIAAPDNVAVAATVGSGTDKHAYVVTSLSDTGLEESLASDVALGASHNISAITQANPGVITTGTPHNLAVNGLIYISGVGGMVELVDAYYRVNTVPAGSTLTIKDLDGNVIDTSGYTAYTSGGTVEHAFITNDLTTAGNYNTITGDAVSGAVRYNIYKAVNGIYGYIGQTDDITVGFVDDGYTADLLSTPPINRTPFGSASNYPGAVAYYDQRRAFAGTLNQPQTSWTTRPGTESNLSYSIPSQDNDGLTYTLDARQVNQILHLVPLTDLLTLTNTGEWKVNSGSADALTPSTVKARQQGTAGASKNTPLIAGNTVLYVEARGSHVAAMKFALESNAYGSEDVSLLAPHLVDGYTINDWTFQRAPYPVAWATRSDGRLLGMTFVPKQEVQAWHSHDTPDGLFESVCAIPESTNEDMVYAVIERTIDGNTRRYIERMHVRRFTTIEDAFFVDSGLTYDGAATDTITGLWHLEGEEVIALADGNVVRGLTVTDGTVTFDSEFSKIHIGLSYVPELETLPAVLQAEALSQGAAKNVNRVHLRVNDSRGFYAGPASDLLREYPQRTSEAWGDPADTVSGVLDELIDGDWNQEGGIIIQQQDPLPLSILSIAMEVALGD